MERLLMSRAAVPTTQHAARRGLAVFFAALVPLTALAQVTLVVTRNPLWVYPLMWTPALASIIARLVLREGFADVSFRWGGRRTWQYLALAPVIPLIIGFAAYGTAWITGLAQFDPHATGLAASLAGPNASPLTTFLAMLVVTATVGSLVGMLSAGGEEIGWRGYMLTRLIDAGVPRPVLVSGIIWGLWHEPLILAGMIYTDSPPLRAALMFMVAAPAFAFVLARFRLETGSIWPAIALHAAYNSIIQDAFRPATTGAGAPLWVGMEAGILVVLVTVVVAVVVSRGHWTIRYVPDTQPSLGAPSPAPQP